LPGEWYKICEVEVREAKGCALYKEKKLEFGKAIYGVDKV